MARCVPYADIRWKSAVLGAEFSLLLRGVKIFFLIFVLASSVRSLLVCVHVVGQIFPACLCFTSDGEKLGHVPADTLTRTQGSRRDVDGPVSRNLHQHLSSMLAFFFLFVFLNLFLRVQEFRSDDGAWPHFWSTPLRRERARERGAANAFAVCPRSRLCRVATVWGNTFLSCSLVVFFHLRKERRCASRLRPKTWR